MDKEAWWATVHGVAKSQTRLSDFTSTFTCGSAGKESACNAEDRGSIPGLGRSPGEGKGYPLRYSGLENSMDCIVNGVTKSQTQLSDFHFHFLSQFYFNFLFFLNFKIFNSYMRPYF